MGGYSRKLAEIIRHSHATLDYIQGTMAEADRTRTRVREMQLLIDELGAINDGRQKKKVRFQLDHYDWDAAPRIPSAAGRHPASLPA